MVRNNTILSQFSTRVVTLTSTMEENLEFMILSLLLYDLVFIVFMSGKAYGTN